MVIRKLRDNEVRVIMTFRVQPHEIKKASTRGILVKLAQENKGLCGTVTLQTCKTSETITLSNSLKPF